MRLAPLAWRSLAARPLRTALTAAGVALGVAVILATLIVDQASVETVARAARASFGDADLRVRAFADAGFTDVAVALLDDLPGVERSAAVSERRLLLSTAPGPEEQIFNLLVRGVDAPDEVALREPPLTAGAYLSRSSPGDVLVGEGWAAGHGLGLGDELLLTGARIGMPPLRIVRLLAGGRLGLGPGGALAVVNRTTLEDAFEATAPASFVDLAVASGREAEVQAALDDRLREPFVVETPAVLAARLDRAQSGFAALAF